MEVENRARILLDPSDLCRICLTTNQSNYFVFGAKQNDLSEKLRLCSGVEITENDGLPANICAKCMIRVDDAHELRKQCERSDIWLRELYGKLRVECNTNQFKTTKDQCCQTDYTFTSDFIKMETNVASPADRNVSPIIDRDTSVGVYMGEERRTITESNHVEYNEPNNHPGNANIKCKQTGCEKREAYRTRRTTMFKRVTSMENLRNHKERQRQYIKKNANVKRDMENEHSGNTNDAESGNSYSCSKCNRCYSTKKYLDKHMSSHKERYTCDKCDEQFFQLDKLAKHSKLHKVKEKLEPVLCGICNKTFKKTDTMVRHLNVHKRANPKEVLSILKEIRDKRKLENINEPEGGGAETKGGRANNENGTFKSEHENCNPRLLYSDTASKKSDSPDDGTRVHRCRYCGKCYLQDKLLEEHLLLHIEKGFVCNVCNMKFFRQDRLESHKNRYGHNEAEASLEPQRPSDEKSAIKLINSWIREELDSDNEEKGFPCKICGKSYDTKRSLQKHQLNAHSSQEEGCASCGDACTCEEKVKEKDQQKAGEMLKSYRCDDCNKSFETETKLQRHAKIHERAKEQEDANFKRFLCHICSKTFRQNTGLMFHMRTHTGHKPHVCKYCGRGFTSNSNCINHERTHTGDRPFVCHFCSAAFAKSCTLKAHITTHTGEANYHCKTCGKSFRRLKYLKEHRFTHTGEKPYACKICGTAYSHNGSLFVHEKKCKAQYRNAQNHCQSETSSPSVTPIITILPQAYLNEVILPLTSQESKVYVNDIQRINSPGIDSVSPVGTPDLQTHPTSDTSDVSLAVKNFALIGHMFQS